MTAQSTPGRKIKPRMLVSVIVFLLYTPLLLFISSGQLGWWMAWLYSLLSAVLSLGSRILMARKHPDRAAYSPGRYHPAGRTARLPGVHPQDTLPAGPRDLVKRV